LLTQQLSGVEIALKEAKAGYNRFEIDLSNKPEWFAPQVNPASKVRREPCSRECLVDSRSQVPAIGKPAEAVLSSAALD
jgi:hypothetical protein